MADMLEQDPTQSVPLRVSNAMVGLHKVQFGRGPTKARTAFAGHDTLVTTLEDTFTPAERTLAAMGEHQRLREMRMFCQYASEQQFREAVEQITGRQVRGFVTGLDAEHEYPSRCSASSPRNSGRGGRVADLCVGGGSPSESAENGRREPACALVSSGGPPPSRERGSGRRSAGSSRSTP